MRRRTKVMAAFTAAALLFAGCQGAKQPADGAAADTQRAAENVADSGNAEQELVQLKMVGYTFGASTNEDLGAVTEAINEHIRPLIHAEIEWEILNIGVYEEQMNLMLSGDEQVDIVIADNVNTYALQGALVPMDDLLAEHGQGIIDVLGMENLETCKCQGQIYAIPTNKDLARGYTFYYREDWNEQYQLGLENAKSLDDLEAAFAKLKEQDPSKVPVFKNSSSPMTSFYQDWDDLGDGCGVLMNQGESLEVVNLYETDWYESFVTRMYDWQQKGYIYKEAATSTITESDGMATDTYLGLFANYKPGIINNYEQNFGLKMGAVHLIDPYITTSTITNVTMAIPRNTVNAERAMQFLNLLYTDSELVNLVHYGIEGREYVFVDEEKGIITYPEGIDASNKKMDNVLGWEYGNELISYVWEGKPENIWEETEAFNKNANRSLAAGFVFDSSNVINEITYCNNVKEKYTKALESGSLDPAAGLPEFIQELKDAGIDTIIQEKQEQLDAWAETNGIS